MKKLIIIITMFLLSIATFADSFGINQRIKREVGRTEITTDNMLNQDNRLNVRVRMFRDHETQKGLDKFDTRLRLYTTVNEYVGFRTEVRHIDYQNKNHYQSLRGQYYVDLTKNIDNFSSKLWLGLGYSSRRKTSGQTLQYRLRLDNYYKINDYIALSANVYHNRNIEKPGEDFTTGLEGYVYLNYPVINSNLFKLELLADGGADPYSFTSKMINGDKKIRDSYYFYVEPSVKVSTSILTELNSVYLYGQYGYNLAMDREKDYQNSYVRVGLTVKY